MSSPDAPARSWVSITTNSKLSYSDGPVVVRVSQYDTKVSLPLGGVLVLDYPQPHRLNTVADNPRVLRVTQSHVTDEGTVPATVTATRLGRAYLSTVGPGFMPLTVRVDVTR
jgi:hypothetical protein